MGKQKTYATDRICPVCGKEFICYLNSQWVYRGFFNGEKLFCSCGCMRKMEREQQKAKRGRRKKNDGHTEVSKTDQD